MPEKTKSSIFQIIGALLFIMGLFTPMLFVNIFAVGTLLCGIIALIRREKYWGFSLGVLILGLILFSAPTIKDTMDEVTREISEPTAQKQETYTFTGYSSDVKTITLNRGVAIFDLNVPYGDYKYIGIKVSNADGTYSHGHIFNEAGESYTGKTSIRIERTGSYLIDIKIDGNWTLKIY